MKVLIAGSTGLVGRNLLFKLLMDNHVTKVIALVRRSTGQRHPKLEELKINFEDLGDYQHDLKADVVYCCLGTTMKQAGSKEKFYQVDYIYPLHLAELTLQKGTRQFNIITAIGANKRSLFFYNRVKGEIEEAISHLNFENVNIFRPSLLVGNRRESRFGESLGIGLSKFIDPLLIGPMKKYRSISADDVAKAMLKVSLKNHKGVHIYPSDRLKALANA